jgi:MFS family permease
MTSSGPTPDRRRAHGLATETACYATGFFSLGLVPMMSLAVPLWSVALGASPFMIGLVVGARSVLPLLFSIHGGSVMDRLGVRRVLLWLAASCMLLAPLYPVLPWVPALVALQLAFGLAQGLSWVGAQAETGRLTRGSPTHAGRFSFASTAGTFAGPLVLGLAWDLLGPTGAFLTAALWCTGLWIAVYFLPRQATTEHAASFGERRRGLLPRFTDYRDAALLLAMPAVGLVVIATFGRIAAISIQGSFYTVYLETIGLSGTQIGALIATSALVGSFAALLTGPLSRTMRLSWLLIGAIGLSVSAMTATPFLVSVAPLAGLAVLFGAGIGLTLPPILSILARSAGPGRQGLGVGLRTTANRLASLVIPVAMGAAADLFGLVGAFLAVGAGLALALVVMGIVITRHRL